MKVADIIRLRRKELNLTLEQIGDIVGVGKSTVRKWEIGGIANMRRDKLAKLAEALQIDPMDLIGIDDTQEVDAAYIRIWAQPLVDAYRDAPEFVQLSICQLLNIPPIKIPKLGNED